MEIKMLYIKRLQTQELLKNADRSLVGEDVLVRISHSGFSLSYLPAAEAKWLNCPAKSWTDLSSCILFGAYMDGKIIGTCTSSVTPSGNWLEILDIRVDAQFRRQYAGKALIDANVDYAEKAGLAGLRLVTNDQNAVACQFCEHTGFHLQGIDRMADAGTPEELQKPISQRTCQLIFYRQKG